MIEKIEHNGNTLALILRNGMQLPEGSNFFTGDESPFQLGVLNHKSGTKIKPHVHKKAQKIIEGTQEFLYINKGRVLAEFFSEGGDKVEQTILAQGDAILLMSGGHGFRMLEDSRIVELKQGPYLGKDADKEGL